MFGHPINEESLEERRSRKGPAALTLLKNEAERCPSTGYGHSDSVHYRVEKPGSKKILVQRPRPFYRVRC